LARIVVIRHANEPGDFSRYMLSRLCALWEEDGHEIHVLCGCDDLPDADLAILHVDLSVVPDEYAAAVRRYPRVVNGGAIDLRKRAISRNLLAEGDDWPGKVIIKPDLNFAGIPELRANLRHAPAAYVPKNQGIYWIARSLADVPDAVWDNERLVVERYLPEEDGNYHYLRVYNFFGDAGRSRICRSHSPIVKGPHIIDTIPGPEIPEEIMAERKRLGMDYGKFDYVLHEGKPVLLDANRTPSFRARGPMVELFNTLRPGLASVLAREPAI
jgi:hypothetical protein